MKRNSTLFFFLLLSYVGWAQQATQYSLYQLNPYGFNPAYAGMDESLSLVGVYRSQWVGLEGNPVSQNVSVHLPFYFIGGGVGLNANNDEIGVHRTTQIRLSYSKYLSMGASGQLGIGLSGGLQQQAWMGSELRAPDGDYEGSVLIHNDNFLPENDVNAIAPTFGIGVFYKNENWRIGLSADNIAESRFDFQLENNQSELVNKRHYYIYGAYRWDVSDILSLTPNTLMKTDLVETQLDIGVQATISEIFMLGANFRGFSSNTADAVVLMAGMQINANVRFGYAYDITLSKLNSVSFGSHEILISYNLNKDIGAGIPPPIIYNPRSL